MSIGQSNEWTRLSDTITTRLQSLEFRHNFTEWLLQQLLAKVEQMVADVDTFITDMTAKMATLDAGVASLKPFIADLFAKIGTIPGLTPAQMTALDTIEADVTAQSAAIAAAMGPPVP